MKMRGERGATKVDAQMTPMIDVVFQLLVFFLFSFKILPEEGEIAVNMPPMQSGAAAKSQEVDVSEKVKIRLRAAGGGQLDSIGVGEAALGSNPQALTDFLKQHFAGANMKEAEVEVDADRRLQYFYLIRCANAIQAAGIRKINFTDNAAR